MIWFGVLGGLVLVASATGDPTGSIAVGLVCASSGAWMVAFGPILGMLARRARQDGLAHRLRRDFAVTGWAWVVMALGGAFIAAVGDPLPEAVWSFLSMPALVAVVFSLLVLFDVLRLWRTLRALI
ncbi:MAG: hypothetical protein D6692_00020 [Planctomycetota bacterium]|nr:MAG: hypothetical protein D6692_00020 [Planctomycetota bacterium]